jgi:3-oxoacyl-[acyl-carrier-protein] synthase-3
MTAGLVGSGRLARISPPDFPPRLLGLGAAQPGEKVSGAELGKRFGKDAEWIEVRTGIRSVYRIADASPEAQVDEIFEIGRAAGSMALKRSGLEGADIDLVLTASCSVNVAITSRIASMLAPSAGWAAINSACSGFGYALSSAQSLISTGSARRVLVVAIEHMSSLLDPDDLGTSIIFGDGAGAAVVGCGTTHDVGIGPVVWGSDGERREHIECDAQGKLVMAGREVFRWAVESVPGIALEACDRAGVHISDIDVFVPHQANVRIIDAVVSKLGLSDATVARDIAESGNTSAASIPIALTRLLANDPTMSGRLGLLVGFGAGMAYAAQVVRLPQTS